MKNILFIILLLTPVCVSAQLSTDEKPISFDNARMSGVSKRRIKKVTMPSLDMAKIEKEDAEDEEMGFPPRFGYKHKVHLNLQNSGTWKELANGDRLWQLNIVCPGALSVNLLYDKFWLPEGGKLFIYSKDKSHSIGAFTSRNNKGDRDNVRGFATGLVYGDDVILEYWQPRNVTEEAIISIDYVVHGYRHILINSKGNIGFGLSGPCQVNINCPEGQSWQKEKKAVAMILVDGERLCTGSLINTTELNETPYLLTANHCIDGDGDAVNNPNLDYYTFWWNYEVPGCNNITVEPIVPSTSGATVIANNATSNSASDFALLRLTEDPKEIIGFTPYYLGWDHSGDSGNPGVCIHHPMGDVKKIATVAFKPYTDNFFNSSPLTDGYYWTLQWKRTQSGKGFIESGSSGSALLTAAHKVIGQLIGGGPIVCDDDSYGAASYGKFNISWVGITDSICRRLDHWLDPNDIGGNTLDGLWVIKDTITINNTDCQYSNVKISSPGMVTVQSTINMNNRSFIVNSGGKLIVDGGTLNSVNMTLKPGASLLITNGGIVNTSHGFAAPVGATVTVLQGKIE